MPVIPCAEWLPDLPAFNNPGGVTATNVLAKNIKAYGPFPGINTTLSALTNRCQGAVGVRDAAGNAYIFAGDSTKLYKATAGASSFTDVSIAGGYNIVSTDQWQWAQNGDNLYAANVSDAIQTFQLGVSTAFAVLASAAPKAKFVAMVRNFLVAAYTNDATNGTKVQRLWWSALGDPTNWPTLGGASAAAVQSDAQDVTGTQGVITGIVANVGPQDAVVFFERAVFAMNYIGSPDVFSILPLHGVRGCIAPGSIALTEAGVIYLSEFGWMLFNGQTSIPIGMQKVDLTFYADVDTSNLSRLSATIDPTNGIYYCAYPSTLASNANSDKILTCSYRLESTVGTPGRWTLINDSSVVVEVLCRTPQFGYNEETAGNTGYNTDTSPYGPDSPVWAGVGRDLLTGFNTSHTPVFFNASNLAATVDTTETQPIPGRFAKIDGNLIPLVDGGTPSIALGYRNRQEDAVTFSTASAMDSNGFCQQRMRGKYIRGRITMPGSSSFTHIMGIETLDGTIQDGGMR